MVSPRVGLNIDPNAADKNLETPRPRCPSMSKRHIAAALAAVLGVAAAFGLATTSGSAKPLSRQAYLTQARAICREYSADFDRIPPIQDPTLLGDVLESANAALPLLHEQAYRIQELTPPAALKARVDRFFVLTDRSI